MWRSIQPFDWLITILPKQDEFVLLVVIWKPSDWVSLLNSISSLAFFLPNLGKLNQSLRLESKPVLVMFSELQYQLER